MTNTARPILYSFRRCPYAMRGRLALQIAGVDVELREVDLKNKPDHMLEVSPKGTVPVLILQGGTVIDESLDVINWALKPSYEGHEKALLDDLKNIFIAKLNEYKYPSRFDNADPEGAREICEEFLGRLNALCVKHSGYLAGAKLSALDIIIFPFVRQFRIVSEDVFNALPYPALKRWTHGQLESDLFKAIMVKHDPWTPDQEAPVILETINI